MTREQIGQLCLALPATTLDHAFGADHDIYRVGSKMFAIVSDDGGVSFKVSDIAYDILTETGQARPAPYMARAKWVNLPDPSVWGQAELAEHFAIAHRIVASKLTKKVRADLGLV